MPPNKEPDRDEEPLVDLTEGRLGEEEELFRPNPPLLTVLEGLRVWKLFCEVVGLRKGALILLAVLLALGELAELFKVERVLRCIVDVLTRFEMSRR